MSQMIQCQACGQSNNGQSNFCRFCGARMLKPERRIETENDFSPPRPYVWKTDEFNLAEPKQRRTEEFRFNDPASGGAPIGDHPFQTRQIVYQQPYGTAKSYGCPRCKSDRPPRVERKISNVGWIIFAVFLVAFPPLFWVGFLIKEDVATCPVCNLISNPDP